MRFEAMTKPNMEQSIEPHVTCCWEDFCRLSQTIRTQPNIESLQKLLDDSAGRFRVWCGNIGAHRTDKSSLDYRLRESRRMKSTVVGFLQDLRKLLSDGEISR